MNPNWKTGFEIELLAPRTLSRLDLADRIARARGGTVRRFFHPQSEPAQVKGKPSFENLTQGFEAFDAAGQPLARFVDDMTLQDGLNRQATPLPGWYRIITDDGRLMRLIVRHCDPEAPLSQVLTPAAALFGTKADAHASAMIKVSDDQGASIAIAAPLPGERERTCEIITPPLLDDQREALEFLLGEASASGFLLPLEGAVHIHFDAAPLRSAGVIVTLVTALSMHRDALRHLFDTNPHCRRLGAWPDQLQQLVANPDFRLLGWPAARKALATVGLEKYCDFNLVNLINETANKDTFEVRILPASLDTNSIVEKAEFIAALLHWSVERSGQPLAVPNTLTGLIAVLPLPPPVRQRWIERAGPKVAGKPLSDASRFR